MFGASSVSSGLSFGKILNGISKTLSIANQVIPLYQQAKPMISNAKTILSVLKGVNTPVNKTVKPAEVKTVTVKESPKKSDNQPIFFQ